MHILTQIFKCFKSHVVFLHGAWSHLPIEEAGCCSVFPSLSRDPQLLNNHVLDAKSLKSTPSLGMQAISTRLHQIWGKIVDQSKLEKRLTGDSKIRGVES